MALLDNRISALLKPAFWLACIAVTALSLTPIEHLPPQLFDWWDKAQHSLAFFVLGCLGCGAYQTTSRWLIGGGLLVLGVAIEVAQDWLGWRYGEISDVVADAIGVLIAVGLAGGLESMLRGKQNNDTDR